MTLWSVTKRIMAGLEVPPRSSVRPIWREYWETGRALLDLTGTNYRSLPHDEPNPPLRLSAKHGDEIEFLAQPPAVAARVRATTTSNTRISQTLPLPRCADSFDDVVETTLRRRRAQWKNTAVARQCPISMCIKSGSVVVRLNEAVIGHDSDGREFDQKVWVAEAGNHDRCASRRAGSAENLLANFLD